MRHRRIRAASGCFHPMLPLRRENSMTMLELLVTILIVAALIAGVIFFIANYVSWSQNTADKQTYTILNDALTRYKTQGGGVSGLTYDATIDRVLAALQTQTTWVKGQSYQFLDSGVTYHGRSIGETGTGAQYHFSRYNTYYDGSGQQSNPGGGATAPTFVAVAYGGTTAASSPDGVTWTARTLPSSAYWDSVVYGNGTLVAVATGSSKAATSPDGITWTARTLSSSSDWNQVAYGNGIFVAVADDPAISTSPDGITWAARTPSSATWQAVAYGNGTFVAVAYGGNKAATSPDGITWTARTLPSSSAWQAVAYGNGIFVAIAFASNKAATSPDGITWTASTLPSSANWQAVAYGNGTFVAVVYGSNAAATSPDGIT